MHYLENGELFKKFILPHFHRENVASYWCAPYIYGHHSLQQKIFAPPPPPLSWYNWIFTIVLLVAFVGDDPSKARIFIRFETSAQKKVEENQIYFV